MAGRRGLQPEGTPILVVLPRCLCCCCGSLLHGKYNICCLNCMSLASFVIVICTSTAGLVMVSAVQTCSKVCSVSMSLASLSASLSMVEDSGLPNVMTSHGEHCQTHCTMLQCGTAANLYPRLHNQDSDSVSVPCWHITNTDLLPAGSKSSCPMDWQHLWALLRCLESLCCR